MRSRPRSLSKIAVRKPKRVVVWSMAFPQAVPSNKEGQRKIVQGGVKLDGEVATDADVQVTPAEVDGQVLQLGKRNWARLRASA